MPKKRSNKYFNPEYIYRPKINRKHQKIIVLTIVTLFLIICLFLVLTIPKQIKYVEFSNTKVSVELAVSNGAWQRGLMYRQSMPQDHGMLFIFPDINYRTFWMKNTLIPLDMIFISQDYVVVDLKKDFQPCTTDPCEIYTSKRPAQYLLEVNANFTEVNNVKVGDVVTID